MGDATNAAEGNAAEGGRLSGLLFASDFDGTLLMRDGLVPRFVPGDREAIRAFREAGGLFGICTGRPERALMFQVPKGLGLDFVIAASGATVLDGELNVLETHTIPREAMLELVGRWCGRTRRAPGVAVGGRYHSTALVPLPSFVRVRRYEDVPDGVQCVSLPFRSREEATAARLQIVESLGDVVEPHQNEASIDVTSAGVSKGVGLEAARRLLDARVTAAIGDSFNDLPMIEAADRGYTFRRADARVRARADVLVDTVAEALADFSETVGGPRGQDGLHTCDAGGPTGVGE